MSVERLNDDVDTVKELCDFGNSLNASGDSEMTVVARTRIGWMRFRDVEKFCMKKVFIKLKWRVSISYLCRIVNTIWKRYLYFSE